MGKEQEKTNEAACLICESVVVQGLILSDLLCLLVLKGDELKDTYRQSKTRKGEEGKGAKNVFHLSLFTPKPEPEVQDFVMQ